MNILFFFDHNPLLYKVLKPREKDGDSLKGQSTFLNFQEESIHFFFSFLANKH